MADERGITQRKTARPGRAGHPVELRELAIAMYAATGDLMETARQVGVGHEAVLAWLAKRPEAVEESRRSVATRAEAAIAAARDKAISNLLAELENPTVKTGARDLSVVVGVMTDKLRLMREDSRDTELLPGDAVGPGAAALAAKLRAHADALDKQAALAKPIETEAIARGEQSSLVPVAQGSEAQGQSGAVKGSEETSGATSGANGGANRPQPSLPPLGPEPLAPGLRGPEVVAYPTTTAQGGGTTDSGPLSPKRALPEWESPEEWLGRKP